jgi:uncharacterized membrane protein YcaP (DUF421 family)
MAMKNLFRKNNFDSEKMVLITAYVFIIFGILTTISILSEKRKIAEEFCSGKKGILIQDKSGEFYCIKGKSLVLLSD